MIFIAKKLSDSKLNHNLVFLVQPINPAIYRTNFKIRNSNQRTYFFICPAKVNRH